MGKKQQEEGKPGVPAFMATFADLMTLLLVFFILLNVYAREKQAGLMEAMSGSFAQAFHGYLGLGGLNHSSRYINEQNAARSTFAHHDLEDEEKARQQRTGVEVELRDSRIDQLENAEVVELAPSFAFPHGSAELPRKGRQFLDELARDLSRGNFVLHVQASAGFVETLTPMELACRRTQSVLRYLRKVGSSAVVEPEASVMRSMGAGKQAEATYRGLKIRIVRER
ncbi:MAG: flagellar motor protein MotB [Planctomycetota bacterium]